MRSLRAGVLLAALLLGAGSAHASGPDAPAATDQPAPAAPAGPAEAPLVFPPLERPFNRVHGAVRPFFNLAGPGAGAIADLTVEHYFKAPWKLAVELSPLALVSEPEGLGAIAHARVRGAFASDYVEVGLGIGARAQHFGPSGWSIAPNLRLGSLDGLNFKAELGYSLIRNYYTQQAEFAWADAIGELDVPLARRLAVAVEAAYGVDLWAYVTLGMKEKLFGTGGPGTVVVGGSLGLAWVVDRFPCEYSNVAPCRGAAWGFGPTIGIEADWRF